LAQIIHNLQAGNLSPEKLPDVLQKTLNISKKVSRKIAEDLQAKVIVTPKKELKPTIKPPSPQKPDIYREPIE